MLTASAFDEAYTTKPCNYERPICQAPECFIASYPPIAKVGDASGRFFVNTYLLQPNRFLETVGPVTVRSEDFKCSK